MLFATLLTSTSFVACSSDDDNENGNGNGNVSSVETPLQKEGKLLLSGINSGDVYNLTFEYDDQLRPTGCYVLDEGEYDYEFKIDYDKGIMEWDDNILTASFNDKGYITKLKCDYSEIEDGDKYDWKIEHNYTYDKEGHLIKFIFECNNKYQGEDIYGTDIDKQTVVFTWENGNLVSCTGTEVEQNNHNGQVENISSKWSQTFTYGNQPNKFKQYIEITDDEAGTMLSGILGVFSEKLPITLKETYTSNSDTYGEYSDHYEYKGSFTLNADGSINTETWTNNDGTPYVSFAYHYTSIDQNAPKSKSYIPQYVPTRASSASKIKEKIRSLKNLPFMLKRKNTRTKFLK